MELRTKMHFSDKTLCLFTPNLLILNAISNLSHLRRVCISFPITVGAQKPVPPPKVQKQWTKDGEVNHVWCAYETDYGGSRSGPAVSPSLSFAAFACSAPSPRPSGIQACPLFILPLAPRAHSFKYSDRWMDTAMRIVSSLLQNVPENHIFPSFPSGILNTQNQVNFSTDSEVNKSSTMQEFYSIPNGKGIFFKL